MDIDEQSVNDILDLDEEHEGWSDFSIEEELPLLTNNCLTKSCEEIATDIDTFNATLDNNTSENRHSCSTIKESSHLSGENNNKTCLCQASSKSADVLSLNNNDCKDIMAAEEVIEIILEQIIDNVIGPDQVQAVLQFQDQDYFYVQDKEDQVRKLNSGSANHSLIYNENVIRYIFRNSRVLFLVHIQ